MKNKILILGAIILAGLMAACHNNDPNHGRFGSIAETDYNTCVNSDINGSYKGFTASPDLGMDTIEQIRINITTSDYNIQEGGCIYASDNIWGNTVGIIAGQDVGHDYDNAVNLIIDSENNVEVRSGDFPDGVGTYNPDNESFDITMPMDPDLFGDAFDIEIHIKKVD